MYTNFHLTVYFGYTVGNLVLVLNKATIVLSIIRVHFDTFPGQYVH